MTAWADRVLALSDGFATGLGVAHLSLTHGWVPTILELVAAATLVLAVGRRTRRWSVVWLPAGGIVGAGAAIGAYWYVMSAGLAGDPAPAAVWIWIGLSGLAAVIAAAGWRAARWWRRGLSVLAIPLSLLCASAAVNTWVGYFPTVGAAWNELTGRRLPDQTDRATVAAMQLARQVPAHGAVVEVTIPANASGFKHRDELVYLPPAWFSTNPPPRLPAVMMIGAQFNTPTDWIRAGGAVETLDAFAAAHGGNTPVFVFVDSGGAFNIDTECVNGSRGNAADHLTKDVVPFMISTFGVSSEPSRWGVVGFSAGGTCALDLAVMRPDLFSAFVDIGGGLSPNTGSRAQTIDWLFSGDAAAWKSFDPTTVITRHGRYEGVSGWFVISGAPQSDQSPNVLAADNAERRAAGALCGVATGNGIHCTVVAQPGTHDWPFARRAFTAAMPWLAGRLGTPGTGAIPLP